MKAREYGKTYMLAFFEMYAHRQQPVADKILPTQTQLAKCYADAEAQVKEGNFKKKA